MTRSSSTLVSAARAFEGVVFRRERSTSEEEGHDSVRVLAGSEERYGKRERMDALADMAGCSCRTETRRSACVLWLQSRMFCVAHYFRRLSLYSSVRTRKTKSDPESAAGFFTLSLLLSLISET